MNDSNHDLNMVLYIITTILNTEKKYYFTLIPLQLQYELLANYSCFNRIYSLDWVLTISAPIYP